VYVIGFAHPDSRARHGGGAGAEPCFQLFREPVKIESVTSLDRARTRTNPPNRNPVAGYCRAAFPAAPFCFSLLTLFPNFDCVYRDETPEILYPGQWHSWTSLGPALGSRRARGLHAAFNDTNTAQPGPQPHDVSGGGGTPHAEAPAPDFEFGSGRGRIVTGGGLLSGGVLTKKRGSYLNTVLYHREHYLCGTKCRPMTLRALSCDPNVNV